MIVHTYKRCQVFIVFPLDMVITPSLNSNFIPSPCRYCAIFEVTSSRKNCVRGSAPWAKVLTTGTKICVECQSKAMDRDMGSTTCVGHGSMAKDTFWTAVNAHGCHGWWRRTNELSECSCNTDQGTDFIFV